MAQEPEVFQYDADGNLTNDGRWQYIWDGENRLVQMIVNTNVGPQYTLNFAYDPNGRRIQKISSTNGVTIATLNYLYDGWNLVATLSSDLAPLNTFMWGSDLSGSMQGAGGVGGLLETGYTGGSTTTNCFPAFDGNGNVIGLANVLDGALSAQYDYGPFGELFRSTGSMAKENPIRFSTKYADVESDMLYYGFRFYKPSSGTWVNRDPEAENGGVNLYCFANDDPVDRFDRFGLDCNTGTCGLDITAALNRTMENVNWLFWNWDSPAAYSACRRLHSLDHYGLAWDIRQLRNIGAGAKHGSGPCAATVTYNGHCHYAGAANYELWGRTNCLCNLRFGLTDPQWTLSSAIALDLAYFIQRVYPLNADQWDKIEFTIHGHSGLELIYGTTQCRASTSVIKNYAFDWRWLPVKNWTGQK